MGHPTWQNAFASSLIRTLDRSKRHPLHFAYSVDDAGALENRVATLEREMKELQCTVAELETKHKTHLHIILILINLRFEFLTDQGSAKLLRCCGVGDAAALVGHEAKALHARMERENKKQAFVERVPDVATVESWIQAAKLAAE